MFRSLKNASVSGKTVFVRLDTDVPLNGLEIEDDTRLKDSLPTIEYLLKHGAKVIIAGHLGRPEKKVQSSKFKVQSLDENRKYSLEPVAKWFGQKFKVQSARLAPESTCLAARRAQGAAKRAKIKVENMMIGDFTGWKLAENLFVLENLRFYKGEEDPTTGSGQKFAKDLASLADIYVNDAFAVCHRAHASIVGVAKLLPHFAGLHLEKEVEVLGTVLKNPKRPLAVVIGGAKLETKLPLVEKMHKLADYVLVGGKIVEATKELFRVQHEKVEGRKSVLLLSDLTESEADITEKSVENFLQIVRICKTVVWNGPVGKVEGASRAIAKSRSAKMEDTERGSRELAKGIVQSGAYTIVGGGDTLGFLKKIHLLDKFDFVSTGGGAMLAFLSGEKLPGLEALEK